MGGPRRYTKRGMALTTIGEYCINGRVAEWQVSEQMLYLQGAKLFYSVVEIFSHFGRKMLKRVGNTGRELHTHTV